MPHHYRHGHKGKTVAKPKRSPRFSQWRVGDIVDIQTYKKRKGYFEILYTTTVSLLYHDYVSRTLWIMRRL